MVEGMHAVIKDWASPDQAASAVHLGRALFEAHVYLGPGGEITATKTGEVGNRVLRVEVSPPDTPATPSGQARTEIPPHARSLIEQKLQAFAHRYGIEDGPDGQKTYWFEIDEAGPAINPRALVGGYETTLPPHADETAPAGDNYQSGSPFEGHPDAELLEYAVERFPEVLDRPHTLEELQQAIPGPTTFEELHQALRPDLSLDEFERLLPDDITLGEAHQAVRPDMPFDEFFEAMQPGLTWEELVAVRNFSYERHGLEPPPRALDYYDPND
ncbi:hypothetical protein [Nocardia sp. NPDC005998]|uniref:hypothetical protein n=1 Tax=Nocardia sp. NPDC005998 TaxID=3156894 RepID=UPI00339EA24B